MKAGAMRVAPVFPYELLCQQLVDGKCINIKKYQYKNPLDLNLTLTCIVSAEIIDCSGHIFYEQ